MPHFILEHDAQLSDHVPMNTLMDSVFDSAVETELFGRKDIKIRTSPSPYSRLGSGHQHFLHITGLIISGRTLEQKKALAQTVVENLKKSLDISIVISCDIKDLEKDIYSKTALTLP
ncbi:hypothetical protein QGN29_13220 [Temperatibacter marinus]|uniref:5-carboxymethyl-2-hydroxymuconate isomerase n=1 Tax=Temperatibacter marinus TaxID=1456591 RepID=A0AA52EG49_9PROT|nr:hypothetical protein [Temperatibacter marinus]WND02508.1 hypothetical protein QGN29_13220 [Temperatibacter marinus]